MAFAWGQFSEKQLDYIEGCDAYINIAHGAVRSGKTISSIVAWMNFLGRTPHTELLMTGKTRDSLERNILNDFFKMIEGLPYKYRKMDGVLEVFGKKIWLVGMKDESVTDKLRGMTVGGWYGDEVNTYPQSAVEMAISRCSLPDSRIFWTLNPDSPYHYIYTDFIINYEIQEPNPNTGRCVVKVWHFTLDDNLNLSEEYKENLKKIYKGIFYDRFILGLWVLAEGSIYDMFSQNDHIFHTTVRLTDYEEFYVGIDYGTSSATSFILVGVRYVRDEANTYTYYDVIKEWYWDADKEMKQLTDLEFAKALGTWLGRIPYSLIRVPHDARSLHTQLEQCGFRCVMVNPDVLEGIKAIQVLLGENQVRIHEKCKNLIMQMQTYVWDPKYKLRGEDKPLKKNDHAVDAFRYAVNEDTGIKPIIGSIGYF